MRDCRPGVFRFAERLCVFLVSRRPDIIELFKRQIGCRIAEIFRLIYCKALGHRPHDLKYCALCQRSSVLFIICVIIVIAQKLEPLRHNLLDVHHQIWVKGIACSVIEGIVVSEFVKDCFVIGHLVLRVYKNIGVMIGGQSHRVV